MPAPPPDMPCTRSCENRRAGCYCDLKKEWDAKQEEKRKLIYQRKFEDNAYFGVRSPKSVKRRER